MVHVAHQFLAKPCGAETLHQVIARTRQLTQLLPDRKLQTLTGQIGVLPCAPHTLQELTQLLERDDPSSVTPALAQLIKQDPALTSKLLQVASSAFFNSSASVADVESAIMRLGLRTLKNLARTLGAGGPARPSALPTITAVQALQTRAVSIARLAERMARLPETRRRPTWPGFCVTSGSSS